jgi:NADPH:quinone reductase-like Zn-dependent oxidoreductase
MRAAEISNGTLVIGEVLTPTAGPGDVVVRVHAAGLNAADLMQVRGHYPAPPGWPSNIPGLELAGEVVSLGEGVHTVALGDRVCCVVGGGAQASHCVVPAEHLLLVPQNVSWEAAGGFAEAFTTAYDALITQAGLQAGERVVISGAAGGVGLAGVQIARAWGAHVIAVTRDDEHHESLKLLGADETITLEQVNELTPVNVVLELVGAAHLSLVQRVLAPRARVVVIGVASGSRVELELLSFMTTRATLTGSTLRARSRDEKAEVAQHLRTNLLPLWEEGKLEVRVAHVFAFDDVNDAYESFAKPGKLGKIILRVA